MLISDLVNDRDLKIRLRVPGSPGRLDRPISWCAPTEHMDPTPFLSVNALVLTNGMGLNVTDYRIWDAYVERLVSVPVSALAFGIGTAHHDLPVGLVQACRSRGLPLLELPPEVPFVLVMRHVEQILASERSEELRKGWELADGCTRLAAGGHSLAEVLERVAQVVDARVAVLDQNGFELISAGRASGTSRTTLRLPSDDSHRFKLMIEGLKSSIILQPVLGPVAAVISMQLSYTLGSRSPLHSPEAARFMEALYSEKGPSLGSLRRHAVDAGFNPDMTWASVLIAGSEDTAPARLRAVAWRARVQLQSSFTTVRFMEEAGLTTLLVQRSSESRELVEAVRDLFSDTPEVSVVVSDCGSTSELPLSLQLARRQLGTPGVTLAPLADLTGIAQGLPNPGLVAISRRLLAPLRAAERSVLMETLEAYLRLSGNSRAICRELFIHRNTLSYRMARIEELLHSDLADGQVRATYMLALTVIKGSEPIMEEGWTKGANQRQL